MQLTPNKYSTLLEYIFPEFVKGVNSKSDQISILKKLLKNGADINYQTKRGRFTLLHDSFFYKELYIFGYLLKIKGIDLEKRNVDGYTPLYFVFYFGDIFDLKTIGKFVKILANCGADFETRDDLGISIPELIVRQNVAVDHLLNLYKKYSEISMSYFF